MKTKPLAYKYSILVFDFDGTLVDTNEIKTKAFGKLYTQYGEDVVRKVIEYHREHRGVSRFQKFRHWHESFLGLSYTDEIGHELSEKFSSIVLEDILKASFVEGVKEFLEQHGGNFSLYIASATPEDELRKIVSEKKIDSYFEGVFGSPTTKAEILKNIIRNTACSPQDVLMVGDASSDLEGARMAGTDFLGVQIDSERVLPPDVNCISNFKEIVSYL